jgi:Zincin-like metallopeptidase
VAERTFTLPSGARVELGKGPELAAFGAFQRELGGLHATFSRRTGQPIKFVDLPLCDFHTLRAILRKLGEVRERKLAIECTNCGHTFQVLPCSTLELGPFRHGELGDPELDAPFDFSANHELPPPRDGAAASQVRLEPRNVGDAAPLHRAIRADRPLRITSDVVRGMGIAAIGDETHTPKIARLLAKAPDAFFDAVASLFESAHYPPRLDVPHRCPECGVVEWVPVPVSRELALEPPEGKPLSARESETAFMDVDAFTVLVREEADAAWRELQIGAIDLTVIEGAAEADDAGEPLLGCYRPPAPEALVPEPAEIRLFYRTFANMWRDEGEYDVRAEVSETIRHELEHHGGHLAGDDPLDDEEQAQIRREELRRVGKRESEARAVRAAFGELSEFARRTWLVWLIALVATALAVLANR